MSTPGSGSGTGLPGGARAAVAAVLLVVDAAIAWILWSHLSDASTDAQHRTWVVVVVSTLIGAACLLAVVVLNLASRGAAAPARPNRNSALSVVTVVAFLKLAALVAGLGLAGALTDVGTVEMGLVAIVEALAVIWLLVGTTKHLARLTAPS